MSSFIPAVATHTATDKSSYDIQLSLTTFSFISSYRDLEFNSLVTRDPRPYIVETRFIYLGYNRTLRYFILSVCNSSHNITKRSFDKLS